MSAPTGELATVARALAGTERCWTSYRNLHHPPALAGSRASAEATTDHETELGALVDRPVYSAHGIALAFGDLTVDHLRAMGAVIGSEPTAYWANQTLARACLEATARGWWLLEPSLDYRARTARFATLHVQSLREIAKLRLTSGRDPMERIAEILEAGTDLGFPVSQEIKQPWVGEPIPNATDLVEMMLDRIGELMFRTWSATLHATTFAMLTPVTPIADAEFPGGRVEVYPHDFARIAAVALLAFGEYADRAVAYFGWPDGEWQRWRAHAYPKVAALIGDE